MVRGYKKYFVVFVLAAIILAGGYAVYRSIAGGSRDIGDNPPVGNVYSVKRGDAAFGINGAGKITHSGSSQVVISVRETDINKVRVGQQAQVWIDETALSVEGTVAGIADKPRKDNSGNVYDVTIVIKGDDSKIGDGSAEVQIIMEKKHDVLAIPSKAVQYNEDGTPYVWTLPYYWNEGNSDNIKPTKRVVRIGTSDERNTEIVDGLYEDEKVIVPVKYK